VQENGERLLEQEVETPPTVAVAMYPVIGDPPSDVLLFHVTSIALRSGSVAKVEEFL